MKQDVDVLDMASAKYPRIQSCETERPLVLLTQKNSSRSNTHAAALFSVAPRVQ